MLAEPEFYDEFTVEKKAEAYKSEACRLCKAGTGGAHRNRDTPSSFSSSSAWRLIASMHWWSGSSTGVGQTEVGTATKEPSAAKSSFIHTIHSLRGVHLYGALFSDEKALEAARVAAELFLSRRLYKRQSDGAVIKDEFTKLHPPLTPVFA